MIKPMLAPAFLIADPTLDGKTHINVYSRGKTPLGRLLSNFAMTAVTLPEDGNFACLEDYWHWLSTGCQHEVFRTANGLQSKQLKKQYARVDIPDFEARFRTAIAIKLIQNPDIAGQLCVSELPFIHYYVYGSPPKILVPLKFLWIIEELEHQRMLLKERLRQQDLRS